MKKNPVQPGVFMALIIFLFLNSCTKGVGPEQFFDPLIGGCQVAEYHNPQFDQFFPTKPPYLFRKTFDDSGKIVAAIDCSFNDDFLPNLLMSQTLHLTAAQKGWIIFLIGQSPTETATMPDTLSRIYLNREGRPDSCVGGPALTRCRADSPKASAFIIKTTGCWR